MAVYQGDREKVIKKICREAAGYPEDKVGILATEETKDAYTYGQVVVAGSRKEGTIAHGLYGALREFDRLGVEVILSESFAGEDKSEAVMNRLLKAAGQHIEYL